MDIIDKDESYQTNGTCFEVHKEKGFGHFPNVPIERIAH